MKQAPAMTIVTILDNSLKRPDGVNYRRVKTCCLCCTHCCIKHVFSSYHAFVEYEYSSDPKEPVLLIKLLKFISCIP